MFTKIQRTIDMKNMEFIKPTNNQASLKGIYSFFCWCSGARLYLLKKCPTDYNVFFGIGMIVFLTGVMAALSGSYAFYTIFNNIYVSVAFGLFWGLLIFFFDWYLVASLRKEKRVVKEIITATPRIVLAIFLAVVISRPLELKLFESEINGQIEKMSQQKYNTYKTVVDSSFSEIEQLKHQNSKYQQGIDELLSQRTQLFSLLIEEAEGRSATGRSGKGSVYKEKRVEYVQISNIYEEEKARIYPLIEANNIKIAEQSTYKSSQLQQGNETMKSATGFLSRIEAYNQLGKDNDGIRFTGLFILIMFIFIETGPMFVKLISKRGAYDDLIAFEEIKVMSETKREIVRINEKSKRIIEIEKLKSRARLDEETENSKDFAKQIMQAQAEIGSERIKRWKEHELNKIDKNISSYRPSIDELIEEARIAMNPN